MCPHQLYYFNAKDAKSHVSNNFVWVGAVSARHAKASGLTASQGLEIKAEGAGEGEGKVIVGWRLRPRA